MLNVDMGGRLTERAPDAAFHADLIHRIANNRDEAAFQALFGTFGPRVKALLMRQGCDPQIAEDIAQEALLAVWRKASLYETGKGSVATWVFTIARNLRIDRIRRETAFQSLGDDRPEEAGDAPLPDEEVSSAQIQARVRAVLAGLPSEQVEVVTLAYIEGLSHSEIADKLGLPMGTVKSRMRLAYQKIRTALEDLQ